MSNQQNDIILEQSMEEMNGAIKKFSDALDKVIISSKERNRIFQKMFNKLIK